MATSISGVAVTPDNISLGLGRESLGVLIGYAFAVYPVRKLYAEVPGFTFSGSSWG